VALADGSGILQTEYTYQPFGATTTSGGTTTNAFGFTGRETDGNGLQYYRARYYDPRIGRFISEDPLELAGGDANFYTYVANSPINFVDPLGLRPLTACEKEKLAPYIPKRIWIALT
jgi:RHS repeat-associated protein